MKNRHLLGALIAFAPVVAIAQVAGTPPVGNASESSTNGAMLDPVPGNSAADPAVDTNAVDAGTDTGTTTTTPPSPTTGTATPDPTAPRPKPQR